MRGKASGQFPDEPQKFVVLGVVAVLVVIILLVVGAGAVAACKQWRRCQHEYIDSKFAVQGTQTQQPRTKPIPE